MAKVEKNFTYTITYRDSEKGIVVENDRVVRARGYGQSWFATEDAARKRLESSLKFLRGAWFVSEVIGWTVSDRNGIIEQGH